MKGAYWASQNVSINFSTGCCKTQRCFVKACMLSKPHKHGQQPTVSKVDKVKNNAYYANAVQLALCRIEYKFFCRSCTRHTYMTISEDA